MRTQPVPYILANTSGQTEPVRELTPDEYAKFERLNGYLRDFEASRSLLPFVEGNARALEQYISKIENSDPKALSSRTRFVEVADDANRLLVNFLTTFRLYLDHTERRIKSTYGVKSIQVAKFEEATRVVFDSEFAYRFCYKLRNYVQHCGLPISFLAQHESSRGIPGELDIHRVAIEFDPQRLLREYRAWGPVTQDLKAAKKRLSVRGFAPTVVDALRAVDDIMYLAEYQELYDAGKWILELLRDSISDGASLHVGLLHKRGRVLNAQLTEPALDVMQVLGVVSFGHGRPTPKSPDYYPMKGYLFRLEWNDDDKTFTATCTSFPDLAARGETREKAMDEAEGQVNRIIRICLEEKEPPPRPLPWREQYKLIVESASDGT